MKQKTSLLTLFIIGLLFSCQKHIAYQETDQFNPYLGSKQQYLSPEKITPLPYNSKLLFVSTVNRHGSRFMSSQKDDIAVWTLLKQAKKQNSLTREGRVLYVQINKLIELQKGNYGLLTTTGKNELKGMGERMYQLNPQFFDENRDIQANATYKERTQDSRDNFLSGLNKKNSLNIELYNGKKGSDYLLRFHKSTPSYSMYLKEKGWEAQYNEVWNSKSMQEMEDRILNKLFDKEFVLHLKSEDFEPIPTEGGYTMYHSKDFINSLFECYKISKAFTPQLQPKLDNIFTISEKSTLSYLADIKAFYQKGPGFEGESMSYSNAVSLLSKVTLELEKAVNGEQNKSGYLNFAHAETTLPLITLLNINDCNEAQDELKKGSWRASKWASMGTNIQWFVLEIDGEKYIHLRFNEQPASLPIDSKSKGTFLWKDYSDYVKTLVANYDVDYKDTNYKKMLLQL